MKKLTVRAERCTGCKRCEIACIEEHSGAKSYGTSVKETPAPKTRIFVEPVGNRPLPLVCRHCQDALCVSACMAGCMQKDPVTGVVTNTGHEQKCVGCWMCVMACPYGVINMSLDSAGTAQAVFAQAVKCDLCPKRGTPACVEACPNEVLGVEEIEEGVYQ